MKNKIKDTNYFKQGFMLFCALSATVLLSYVVYKSDYIFNFIVKIFNILSPIFIGLLFAYLLNPLVSFFERSLAKDISKELWNDKLEHKEFKRAFSIFLTYLMVAIMLILIIIFVIPALLDSMQVMLTNIPTYINKVYTYLEDILVNNQELSATIENLNTNITDTVMNVMVPSVDTLMASIATGITGVIKGIANVVIGLIVSVYLLYEKETFIAGAKKVLKVILPEKGYSVAMTTLIYTDKIFGGFMTAKIIDSLIVGVLTFIITSIFGIPYALIISIVIGITNIIPYFGPIIGAVPSAMFLFLVDPKKCITFIILILLIQQFDGNILGPKLIGNKTGIKSFWVLFSILLFGGLFGFIGMIFGVPIFAVIYSVLVSIIDKKLELKNTK